MPEYNYIQRVYDKQTGNLITKRMPVEIIEELGKWVKIRFTAHIVNGKPNTVKKVLAKSVEGYEFIKKGIESNKPYKD